MPKGFAKHECKTPDCMCYECSACHRRLVEKHKFQKHPNTSDCRHVLSVEQKESDMNRVNKQPVQLSFGGASDSVASERPAQDVQQPPADPPSKFYLILKLDKGAILRTVLPDV